jgi:hypothetical protein
MYEPFHKFIRQAAGKYNFSTTLNAIDVCNAYRKTAAEILPEHLLQDTSAKSFSEGILTIQAANSSSAQLLHMNKHRIHQALTAKFGAKKVREIKITLKVDV